MIVIAGTATIKSGNYDEAVTQAQRTMTATQAEVGCISYQIYVHPTDRHTFFIFEEWETPEALARHFQTEHMQVFSHFLARVLDGEMNIKRYEIKSRAPL